MRTKPIGKEQEKIIVTIVEKVDDAINLGAEGKKQLAREIFLNLLNVCDNTTPESKIKLVLNTILISADYMISESTKYKNNNTRKGE